MSCFWTNATVRVGKSERGETVSPDLCFRDEHNPYGLTFMIYTFLMSVNKKQKKQFLGMEYRHIHISDKFWLPFIGQSAAKTPQNWVNPGSQIRISFGGLWGLWCRNKATPFNNMLQWAVYLENTNMNHLLYVFLRCFLDLFNSVFLCTKYTPFRLSSRYTSNLWISAIHETTFILVEPWR